MLICKHWSCALLLYKSIGQEEGIHFRREGVLEKSTPWPCQQRHSGCLPTIGLLWMNTYTSRIEAKIYKENVILSWVYFNILLKLTCCICMPTAPSHNPVTEFQTGGMLCSFTCMASCIRLPHKPSLPVKVPCPKPPPEPHLGSYCSGWGSSCSVGYILHL